MAETSYKVLEVLSFCGRDMAYVPSVKMTVLKMKRGRGNLGARYREERAREEGSSSSLTRSGHEG